MEVTGEAVWDALVNDPDFVGETNEEMRALMEPIVMMLPDLLGNLLDEPAGLATIFRAKATFLDYALAAKLISAMVGAANPRLVVALERSWRQASLGFRATAMHVPEFMASEGATEEELISRIVPPISEENMARYRSGELTIGELLLSQPRVFVKNRR